MHAVGKALRLSPAIRHQVPGERWLRLSRHSSSGEGATLAEYDDVMLGGLQISGDMGREERLSAACFSLEGISACSRSS